jgi:hypothetical protein
MRPDRHRRQTAVEFDGRLCHRVVQIGYREAVTRLCATQPLMLTPQSFIGGRPMAQVDFTASLYLGFHHPSDSLAPFSALTPGKPASLYAPPEAAALTAELAQLSGLGAATLGTSRLHLF